ncbi:uncharacterized protein LOC108263012 isoform X1 [Ictalurus punctatus]|uniref:Uncharacterized protein LOC108263012 isoform X1 n=1 Tax=Ictalurus punctatus TaxID=7998 RepID=A0A9F7TK48_ICTPU|nr:uncharacterized protein LOC108263012 isoform X1 [Ictalurus punctatus]
MPKPPTLNELKRLEETGFGKPYPRHGLKLLYWFAHDCLYFDDDNEMCWQYDPEERYFGFHLFENRIDKNGDQLLPEVELDYYMVGNLRRAGADDLPDYVREDYIQNRNHSERNMDRIIVSVDDEWFDRVYVTEHSDRTDFNKEATYCISRGLIMIIRRLTLENFLTETGYWTEEDSDQSYTEDDDDDDDEYDYVVREIRGWTLEANTDLITGYSRLPSDSDQRSEEESVDSSGDHDEYENCCKCIIL